jgi:inosine-uridine nucleoside N-ribohydrolase
MKKVIFDTDPGIDDAMALALIQASPALELVGITTVFGNAHTETTTRNAFHLAERFGITAPIRRGAARPLVQAEGAPPEHIHGRNGLGDVELPDTPFALDPEPAHRFIIRMLKAHPGEITLIAVAPLTNLALALQEAPEVAGLAKEVVIMGGAFGWGYRRGNVSPVAEANIFNDPHAADIVTTAAWPITLIGLDVTMRCILTDTLAAGMAKASEAGEFLYRVSRVYSDIYRKMDGIDGCCLHDVAAVAYAIDAGLFTLARGPVRVATEGVATGQTIQKPDGQSFPPGPWDGLPSQSAAKDCDTAGVVRTFLEALERVPLRPVVEA